MECRSDQALAALPSNTPGFPTGASPFRHQSPCYSLACSEADEGIDAVLQRGAQWRGVPEDHAPPVEVIIHGGGTRANEVDACH